MTPDFNSLHCGTMVALIYTTLILASTVDVCLGAFDASEFMPHSKSYSLTTFHGAIDDGLYFVLFFRTWYVKTAKLLWYLKHKWKLAEDIVGV